MCVNVVLPGLLTVHRSKVEDKSAPSKSIPIDQNAAISDIKQAAKQRRASFIGTSDTAGFSFNVASSDPQHPIVGLKVCCHRQCFVCFNNSCV
jgi:hypothetical protein